MSAGLRLTAVDTERIRMADWSGFTDFGGEAEVYAPKSEAEIITVVRDAFEQSKKLRVVGLRTSWNALWHSDDVMMSTSRLKAITAIDPANHTVTCEPGVTLTELHRALWEQGLTLDTAPGPDWVTVAGCLCTASHGSGPPSMSSSMIGCRLVMANGKVIEVSEKDERLDAMRVSLGVLGVLSSVTLRVVDAFRVKLTFTRIPLKDWKRYLTEGEMSYLLWFAHTETCVLARVDVLSDRGGNGVSAEPRSPEPGFDGSDKTVDRFALLRKYMHPLNELANADPRTFPARNRYLLEVFFPDMQVVGPAHKVLMSFQSPGPIAGAEWSVPVRRFGEALKELEQEISKGDFYLPAPVWLKKVRPESAWLSAADEECVQCGIYHSLTPDAPSHTKEMVVRVERLMVRYGGRPHLGKLIYLEPSALKSVYPNWPKFDALRRRMDPTGVFWTKALEARFGGTATS
jgi:FAD/FMN-containing dehydrogenase